MDWRNRPLPAQPEAQNGQTGRAWGWASHHGLVISKIMRDEEALSAINLEATHFQRRDRQTASSVR
ncbi:MAG: hypothetical protein ACI9R3_005827 [Verrucomicrobiales bacterium]|jgi:hypothetical protein